MSVIVIKSYKKQHSFFSVHPKSIMKKEVYSHLFLSMLTVNVRFPAILLSKDWVLGYTEEITDT